MIWHSSDKLSLTTQVARGMLLSSVTASPTLRRRQSCLLDQCNQRGGTVRTLREPGQALFVCGADMRKKQGQHFADIFEVLEKDPDGKRFDKGVYRGNFSCLPASIQLVTQSRPCLQCPGSALTATCTRWTYC